mmetsp:Transcript_101612/g.294051  ORF Transcript_101612/g.294051 Transcript_101612/m.294051 type:complete len:205 (-) Transcript_101612:4361-4975(-)
MGVGNHVFCDIAEQQVPCDQATSLIAGRRRSDLHHGQKQPMAAQLTPTLHLLDALLPGLQDLLIQAEAVPLANPFPKFGRLVGQEQCALRTLGHVWECKVEEGLGHVTRILITLEDPALEVFPRHTVRRQIRPHQHHIVTLPLGHLWLHASVQKRRLAVAVDDRDISTLPEQIVHDPDMASLGRNRQRRLLRIVRGVNVGPQSD